MMAGHEEKESMQFVIRIDTARAAVVQSAPGPEIARILREVALRAEMGYIFDFEGPQRLDFDGVTVGEYGLIRQAS